MTNSSEIDGATKIKIEITVGDGLASTYKLDNLYYGLVFHYCEADRNSTVERFSFCSASDSISSAKCGLEANITRREFERASLTVLDRTLVRPSCVIFDLEHARKALEYRLRRVFLLLRPVQSSHEISASLNMELHIQGTASETKSISCSGVKPGLVLLWSADEWQNADHYVGINMPDDLNSGLSELEQIANKAVNKRAHSSPQINRESNTDVNQMAEFSVSERILGPSPSGPKDTADAHERNPGRGLAPKAIIVVAIFVLIFFIGFQSIKLPRSIESNNPPEANEPNKTDQNSRDSEICVDKPFCLCVHRLAGLCK